jgi:predicted DNA-binding transcriptional regulator AlpA
MKDENLTAILAILKSEPTVSEEDIQQIKRICKNQHSPRKMIKRDEVLKILDVSPPTLLKYIKSGFIKETRLSPRKIRFEQNHVISFANSGISARDKGVVS